MNNIDYISNFQIQKAFPRVKGFNQVGTIFCLNKG